MYQFFVESGQIGKDSVMIEGSDVNHIKNVLRMKPGEKIRISGPAGENYFCEIAEIEDSFVRASILEKDETGTELPNRIYLFQGLPKNDKMELIIQKAVELGVTGCKKGGGKDSTLAGHCGECSKTVKAQSDPKSFRTCEL